MECVLCHSVEMTRLNGVRVVYKPSKEVRALICSDCIQRLLSSSQTDLSHAFNLALGKGATMKPPTSLMKHNKEKEKHHVTETGETRPNLVRERIVQSARPTRDRVRAQQAVV